MNQWFQLTRYLRGSSDEAEAARRSTQSTPRMSRARVRDVTHDQTTQQQRPFGSLGSMEVHRVNRVRERSWESDRINRVHHDQNQAAATAAALNQAALNRSWDIDKVPALDRTWEMERARGMEMVYRSMEKEKERRLHLAQTQAHGYRQKEGKKKKRKRDKSKESQAMMEQIDNNKLSQERLERKIDELNRMLLEEKHQNRKDKLAVAKLQQEVARQKSDRPVRESLMKELDHEHMLRRNAEARLRESAIETENYKARLIALQDEFKKMEEMARTLLQYKNKVDQLKQEKAALSISYEKNMQKFRTENSNLEHENKIVTAELKRLETECDNCQQCNKDLSYRVTKPDSGQSESSDKVKMLLERLKRLEEEKSQLVLENENQRQQYEKCLDEIANQVVQALLSQKGLREECGKLQKRVMDLEDQNRQLKDMFHQRIKFASDSFIQAMSSKAKLDGVQSEQSLDQTKYFMLHGLTGSCDSITPLSQISLGSLQSICSNYQESSHTEDNDPGKPKPSSPPSWLRDQIHKTDSPSSSLCSPATVETMLTLPQTPSTGGKKTRQNPTSTGSVPTEQSHLSVSAMDGNKGTNGSNPEMSLFQGHLVISHSGSQSAFHPVSTSGIATTTATTPTKTGGGGASLTNQIPKSDQAHLHMLHMQNMALQQQRMHLVGNGEDVSGAANENSDLSMVNGDELNNGNLTAFPMSDIDTKLISSIQNAKKRFSQGRLQGVNVDSCANGRAGASRTGSASHTETEFPADNTSPKMKHTSPSITSPTNSDVVHSRQNSTVGGSDGDMYGHLQSPTNSPSSLVQNGLSTNSRNGQIWRRNEGQAEALTTAHSPPRPKPVKLYLNGKPNSISDHALNKPTTEVSPGHELLKMSDSFNDKLSLDGKERFTKIGDFFESDSDDSESSRPLSKNLSMASTMSLNELLEKGLENINTPMDENFSLDNFQIFDSDEEGDFKDPIEKMKWTLSKGKETSGNPKSTNSNGMSQSSPRQQTATDKKGNKFLVNVKKNEQSEKDYGDYVCLKKIREYVFMNMPDVHQGEKTVAREGSVSSVVSPGECTSPTLRCRSVGGGDCKSSQTSPEEVCQCGSCDNVFLAHGQTRSNHISTSRNSSSKSRIGSGRPNDLHLQKKTGLEKNNFGKGFKTGSLKGNNKVSPEKSSLSSNVALNSSYHDYVNLTPEMVQEILSRDTTPSGEYENLRKSSERNDLKMSSSSNSGSFTKGCHGSVTGISNGANDARIVDTSKNPSEIMIESANDSGISESQNTSKISEEPKISEVETASSSSPDSAMQRSYTSTASSVSDKGEQRHSSLERFKYGKDEGYSSNSANSIKTESVQDVTNPKSNGRSPSGDSNSNCNNNIKVTPVKKNMPGWNHPQPFQGHVHLEAEVHAHYEKGGGSLTSLHSVSSVESEYSSGKKLQEIKDYVEGKMEEMRKSMEEGDNGSASPVLTRKKGPLRNVPKTSPYHQRPHSCSPHRGLNGPCSTSHQRSRLSSTSSNPSPPQPVSSLIPKPCLIRHVLRRSHSMSCVIQMAKLARIPSSPEMGFALARKVPSSGNMSTAKTFPEYSRRNGRVVGNTQTDRRKGSQDEGHLVKGATASSQATTFGAVSKGHGMKPPTYKSSQAPNKMKMGISYRRKSETQEDRRIVGEGSETGYRSREELRPEGVVISQYEEEEGSVGRNSVQDPAFHPLKYKHNQLEPLPVNNHTHFHNRTNCKPVLVKLNQSEPDENLVYSNSNQSYSSLSGDSSSLEESIQLLNGIGLPEGLDDLERQYNLMQENLKLKMNRNTSFDVQYRNYQVPKCVPNKSKSLDCIGSTLNNFSVFISDYDGKPLFSQSSLGLNITDTENSSKDDVRNLRNNISLSEDNISHLKDVSLSPDCFSLSQDDISLQIANLSRTVDDIQRSLSSLSIDTLVGDEVEERDKEKNLQQEVEEMESESSTREGTLTKSDLGDSMNSLEGHSVMLKKDSHFLANLILLGCSDDEDCESLESDAFWDTPVDSWPSTVNEDKNDKLDSVPPALSLLNDLSPSPTSPRSPKEFQKMHLEDSLFSPTSPEGSFYSSTKCIEDNSVLNNQDLGCSESHDFYESFCRNRKVSSNSDLRDETLLPFHVDKYVDSSLGTDLPSGKDLCAIISNDHIFSGSDSEVEYLSQRFSLADCPINQRVAKLKEESRLEKDTSIHRLSDATEQSTNPLYKAVLSNALSESQGDSVNSTESMDTPSGVGATFDCEFYKNMCRSFESGESSIGVDGLSLSDSCCGSLSEQESE